MCVWWLGIGLRELCVTFIMFLFFSNLYTDTYYRPNCGGLYFERSGVLNSPNYPERYPNNQDCDYVFVRLNSTVAASLNIAKMEESLECAVDYVQVMIMIIMMLLLMNRRRWWRRRKWRHNMTMIMNQKRISPVTDDWTCRLSIAHHFCISRWWLHRYDAVYTFYFVVFWWSR